MALVPDYRTNLPPKLLSPRFFTYPDRLINWENYPLWAKRRTMHEAFLSIREEGFLPVEPGGANL